jgi:hypothetical protein
MANGRNMAIGRHALPRVDHRVTSIKSERVPSPYMEVWVVGERTGKKDHVTETSHAQVI